MGLLEKIGFLRKKSESMVEQKNEDESTMLGKYVLRDMPLFKYEMAIYYILIVVGVITYFADTLEILPGVTRPLVIPFVVIPFGIWFIKWRFYMPKKNRLPGIKAYRGRGVQLGVFDISKGYLTFGKGENKKKVFLTDIGKHFEFSCGKPFIIVNELEGENLSLLKSDKPDLRSEEFNAILETNTAVTTKNVMRRMMKFSQPGMGNPMMILQLITLLAVAIVVVKEMGFI